MHPREMQSEIKVINKTIFKRVIVEDKFDLDENEPGCKGTCRWFCKAARKRLLDTRQISSIYILINEEKSYFMCGHFPRNTDRSH